MSPADQEVLWLAPMLLTNLLPWDEAVRNGKVRFLDDAPHRAYIELSRRQSVVRLLQQRPFLLEIPVMQDHSHHEHFGVGQRIGEKVAAAKM